MIRTLAPLLLAAAAVTAAGWFVLSAWLGMAHYIPSVLR